MCLCKDGPAHLAYVIVIFLFFFSQREISSSRFHYRQATRCKITPNAGDYKFLSLSRTLNERKRYKQNVNSPPAYRVSWWFYCATVFYWSLNTPFPPPAPLLSSLPRPLLTHSAMNMDRFERGPREILNPEIQKVRPTAEPRPALIIKPSVRPLISCTPRLGRLCLECSLLLWMLTVTLSSPLRICWCWRNRR